MKAFEVLAFDESDSRVFGQIQAQLKRAGTPIGAMYTLIAAHALSRDLILVTNNTHEFARVDGLKIEDWTVE
ncbi:MAG: hypothetical protein O3A00_19495 [Planctomycetota bacterium]|nr:hypothetical protein [Planctomycetota bacterium]